MEFYFDLKKMVVTKNDSDKMNINILFYYLINYFLLFIVRTSIF